MPKQVRLLLAGLTSALLMAVAIGAASANRLASNETQIRLIFTPMVFSAANITPVRCNVTIEKSFHSRTISKVAEALIGYVTAVTVETRCTGGSARANTETLPWHIRYVGFTGTLPSITAVTGKTINSSFTISSSSIPVPCRYRAASVTGRTNIGAGGRVTSLEIIGREIASETFGCPRGELSGTGSVTTGGGGTVTIQLVA